MGLSILERPYSKRKVGSKPGTQRRSERKKEMKLSLKKITTSAVLIALIVILGTTRLGLIPIPHPAKFATIMQLPVIIGTILLGLETGLLLSLIIGIVVTLSGIPWYIAIPGRFFIAIFSFYSYHFLLKFTSKNKGNTKYIIPSTVSGILGGFANSFFTLTLGVIFKFLGPTLQANIVAVIALLPVVLIEAALCGVLTPLIIIPSKSVLK